MLDDVTALPKPATLRNKPGIPHLPGLDGLRGLAVLGVIFFHAGGLLPGGYLGVDLFFVLSGYLITSILLAEEHNTGRIDLAHFWVRRARRLFPALLSLMPAIALYAAVFAKPNELAALRGDALATLAYVANWRDVLSHKSYWQLFAAPSPLEHTWSLAIEEQFYVVWPLLLTLVLVVLRRGRRLMLAVTFGLIACSVAAMLHAYNPAAASATSSAYFRTDTRAAAILAGAALAFVLRPAQDAGARLGTRVRVLDAFGLIALAGIFAAWLTLDGQSPFLYRGGFWLTELACLALIACAVCGQASLISRGLAFPPLAYVGTISYGLYLWHWPVDCVLTLERTHLREPWLEIARLALTFGIAIVSYRYLERPIRSRGLSFARARFVVPSAFAGAALVVVLATSPRSSLGSAAGARAHLDSRWPTPFSVDSHTLPPASALPPGTMRILTLGDSVAAKLGIALRHQQQRAHVFVAQRGVGNCSILKSQIFRTGYARGKPNAHGGCAAHWAADVAELKPDVTLIVLGGAYLADIWHDGKTEWACDADWQDAYRGRLNELFSAMGKNAGRIVLTLVPYPLGRWLGKETADHVDCFNHLLSSVAAAHSFSTLDLAKHICPTRDCIIFSDGEPIRPDGLHPDGKGAEETARWTLTQLRTRVAVDGLQSQRAKKNRARLLRIPARVRR